MIMLWTHAIYLGVSVALTLFLVNSVLVAIFSSFKKEQSFWKVWSENFFSAVTMYLTGAVVAVLTYKALDQINIFLVAAVVGFFGVVFFWFGGFFVDIKKKKQKVV